MKATVDHRIRVPLAEIPRGADDLLIDALCIPNLEREEAAKQHQHGWQSLPETIPMYRLDGDPAEALLSMPRGFQRQLEEGLAHFDVKLSWEDERALPAKFRLGRSITPRDDYQAEAIQDILDYQQGILQAPPGFGKTVAVLAAGRYAATSCCIVVNTKDILWQWVDRIEEHLALSRDHIGQVGGGDFVVAYNWTVATAQTLDSRFDELEASGFFDSFGFACLDECHHATARTFGKIMDRFSAKYRFGVSATPDKTGDFRLAEMILGEVFHKTTPGQLVKSGYLVKPEVTRVSTNFRFGFRGTTSAYSKSNYPKLIDALIFDHERNQLIVDTIMREGIGHHCMTLSKRLDHIDILAQMLEDAGWPHPIVTITGQDKDEARKAAKILLEMEPAMLFSTLADEAFDVPRLDRGFLPYPQRNSGLMKQQMGRFERQHPDKKDSMIFDFVDGKVSVLRGQWRTRKYEVYLPRKIKINQVRADDQEANATEGA